MRRRLRNAASNVPAPYRILIADLHNTLYDEVREFGLAIDAAFQVAREANPDFDEAVTAQELAKAHAALGSDWDADAWEAPSLKTLPIGTIQAMLLARADAMRKMMEPYHGVVETLQRLSVQGIRIYIVTEGAADVASFAIRTLGLEGIVTALYAWPCWQPPLKLKGTSQRLFPERKGGGHLTKPHPYVLACALLDHAKASSSIPETASLEDAFDLTIDPARIIPEIPEKETLAHDCALTLAIRDSYRSVFEPLFAETLYLGDSLFKDGWMARNTGVAFAHAAYGKEKSKEHDRCLQLLYAVTGWDHMLMRLTQEAAASPTVQALRPDITCGSARDLIRYF